MEENLNHLIWLNFKYFLTLEEREDVSTGEAMVSEEIIYYSTHTSEYLK